MPVHGILNLPVVCISDERHAHETAHILELLTQYGCRQPVYLLAHYINPDTRQSLKNIAAEKGLPLLWRECGEGMIYDCFCGEDGYLPTELTLLLLPWILSDEKVLVLGGKITPREIESLAIATAEHESIVLEGGLAPFSQAARIDLAAVRRDIRDIESLLEQNRHIYKKFPIWRVWGIFAATVRTL